MKADNLKKLKENGFNVPNFIKYAIKNATIKHAKSIKLKVICFILLLFLLISIIPLFP